jgi:succinate dehydrogenase/fumarate reductase flavoprotein subunit
MILQKREEYDAIVVGSGVSGGWAAKELIAKLADHVIPPTVPPCTQVKGAASR